MKHSIPITAFMIVMFLSAQLLGLFIISSYMVKENGFVEWKNPQLGFVEFERPDIAPELSIWYIFGAVILGTLLLFLIIKLNKVFLWKAWFFFAVAFCLYVAFSSIFPNFVSFFLALIVAFLKTVRPNPIIHNISELFVYGGLAAIFVPMLNVKYAFILLLVLSVYDMYSVWKSKHMITLAKFQTKSGIFSGIFLPSKPSKVAKGSSKGKSRIAVLGGGDIGFPLIFAGTVLVSAGVIASLSIVAFSTIALAILFLLAQRDKFYPAMPFLTIGCIAGYLISLIL